MVIAVDTECTNDYQEFIFQSFAGIAENHPEHTFIFIEDKNAQPALPSYNISVNINRGSFLSAFKIASILKKHKVDVFVTAKVNSKTSIPQLLVAGNKISPMSLKKASLIFTGSEFSKKEIIEKYKISEKKIDVVYRAADEDFIPIEFDRKEIIKEAYAEAHEYFLVSGGSVDTLLNIMKAFSAFKKMQKSRMQLLVASKKVLPEEFHQKLKSFKYKEEVKVIENIDKKELASLTAAAYSAIFPQADYSGPLNAMRSHSVVIAIDNEIMKEICGEAAIYVNASLPADIADKMMLLYKDEKLRQQLIDRGKEQVKKYSQGTTSTQLLRMIKHL